MESNNNNYNNNGSGANFTAPADAFDMRRFRDSLNEVDLLPTTTLARLPDAFDMRSLGEAITQVQDVPSLPSRMHASVRTERTPLPYIEPLRRRRITNTGGYAPLNRRIRTPRHTRMCTPTPRYYPSMVANDGPRHTRMCTPTPRYYPSMVANDGDNSEDLSILDRSVAELMQIRGGTELRRRQRSQQKRQQREQQNLALLALSYRLSTTRTTFKQ